MIIRQITHIIFQYPEDYQQEYEWCKTKTDMWTHKSQDTNCQVYENEISYAVGVPRAEQTEPQTDFTNCEHWKERKDIDVKGCELLLTNQQTDCPWKQVRGWL